MAASSVNVPPQSPSLDKLTQIATDAAQRFVDSFYDALQYRTRTIASYYVPPSEMADKTPLPTIIINGDFLNNGNDVEDKYRGLANTYFEVQTIDSHIINEHYSRGQLGETLENPDMDISILVVVSGAVRYGDDKEETRAFSESFILVPNKMARNPKGKGMPVKDFLIESQNFRITV